MKRELLYGRLDPTHSLYMSEPLPADAIVMPAIADGVCQRCGYQTKHQLPDATLYCWACANLGRLTERDQLCHLPDTGSWTLSEPICRWEGQLTDAQTKVAQRQVETYLAGKSHLTYAVTGAGKTEMLFPLITRALSLGHRVALVSPRLDVINELAPRLAQAFTCPMVVLHGETETPYQYTPLVLATTHQLLKFYQAFDLVIVDEVDAFPFAEDKMLHRALERTLRPGGVTSYLTATPSPRLRRLVRQRALVMSVLPKRFHGQPLPNFTIKRVGNWRKKLPRTLLQTLRTYLTTGQRFLLFVPEVADLVTVRELIKAQLPELMIGITHAQATDRQAVVQAMRDEELQGLLTTTILERGVTLPGIDVLILGAEERVFSQSALIQIAGRCGRSAQRPTGLVLAMVQEKTHRLLRARAEIDYLNRLAVQDDL